MSTYEEPRNGYQSAQADVGSCYQPPPPPPPPGPSPWKPPLPPSQPPPPPPPPSCTPQPSEPPPPGVEITSTTTPPQQSQQDSSCVASSEGKQQGGSETGTAVAWPQWEPAHHAQWTGGPGQQWPQWTPHQWGGWHPWPTPAAMAWHGQQQMPQDQQQWMPHVQPWQMPALPTQWYGWPGQEHQGYPQTHQMQQGQGADYHQHASGYGAGGDASLQGSKPQYQEPPGPSVDHASSVGPAPSGGPNTCVEQTPGGPNPSSYAGGPTPTSYAGGPSPETYTGGPNTGNYTGGQNTGNYTGGQNYTDGQNYTGGPNTGNYTGGPNTGNYTSGGPSTSSYASGPNPETYTGNYTGAGNYTDYTGGGNYPGGPNPGNYSGGPNSGNYTGGPHSGHYSGGPDPGNYSGGQTPASYDGGPPTGVGRNRAGKPFLLPTPPPYSKARKKSRWDCVEESNQKSSPPSSSPGTPPPTNLSPTPPHSPKNEEESGVSVIDPSAWPPALKAYIHRSFTACSTSEDKDRVEHFLKVELHRIFSEGRTWSIDWNTYPLPLDKDFNKRKRSRWDTPSPTQQQHPGAGGNMAYQPMEDQGKMTKKKRRNKKWKNKLFSIDTGPFPQYTEEDRQRMSQRAQRFTKGGEGNRQFKAKLSINELIGSQAPLGGGEEGNFVWQEFAVEGSSQALEKRYFRLNAAPDPSCVRPPHVLKQSLELVLRRWRDTRDYNYVCEQLKSIRQDLTIQCVRNEFCVSVYEAHARIALENKDREEFNQCQTQLKALYSEKIPGNVGEFVAYRILYLILTDSTGEFASLYKELSHKLMCDSSVVHALKMRSAWALGNYHSFFKFYHSTPNMGGFLVNLFLDREREAALKAMAKAYRPTLKVSYVASELAFQSNQQCLDFLKSIDVELTDPNTIDCKATANKLGP